MDLGLQGKAVLVMASSDGIGKGVALACAREGAKVMLFARREEKLKEVQKEIKRPYPAPGLLCSGRYHQSG